jgi:hypothetical protein
LRGQNCQAKWQKSWKAKTSFTPIDIRKEWKKMPRVMSADETAKQLKV